MSTRTKAVISFLVVVLGISGTLVFLTELGVPDAPAVLTQVAEATATSTLQSSPTARPSATPSPSPTAQPTVVVVTPLPVPGQDYRIVYYDEAYFTPSRMMNRRPCPQVSSACPVNGTVSGRTRVFCLIELTSDGSQWLGLTPSCERGNVVAYRIASQTFGQLDVTVYHPALCEMGAPIDGAFVRSGQDLAVRSAPSQTAPVVWRLPAGWWARVFCLYEPAEGWRWVRIRDGWLAAVSAGRVIAEVVW